MKKSDTFNSLVFALNKRDELLRNEKQDIPAYNRYFDVMRECARELIEQGRQDEMLPLLDNESASISRDIAGLLYHCYPEKCRAKLEEIAGMILVDEEKQFYAGVKISAENALEYGIPEDYP